MSTSEVARAPRFYLAWNDCGVVWRVRHDVPPALAHRLSEIVAAQSASDDLERPPGCTARICAALAEHAPVVMESQMAAARVASPR